MNKITFIIDTNVIFSAYYKPSSKPGIIIMLAIHDKIRLIAPISVKEEIKDKLIQKLRFTEAEARIIISALPIQWIDEEVYSEEIPYAKRIIRDKTDAPLIALHLISGYPILTGDKEILNAKGITAINPAQAIRFLLRIGVITKEELKQIL